MRKLSSNGARLDQHSEDIAKLQLKSAQTDVNVAELQKNLEKQQAEYDAHIKMHVKEDLLEPRFHGSDKWMFSFDDIADRHNINRNLVQKIAQEEGIRRRGGNLNIAK
ncbi:hypothetical protein [Pelosinus propionicus]|uniref:Uncharacterized protein n=1 Tax=Pelosinus propionicus DSM 13327 TaxID=1123291 RepID=A0A1I4QFZ2_9FIRM|nr:hypothetical protein [Pelosinus propionicus]SFM38655.1 hypothetical protein SAMN04490355_109711 [Pelosinus propionicus DSM 13327]